jgi:hypothetical protein
MAEKKHKPLHKYDCGNCKFNWCCGYTCACKLDLPEEPLWLKKQLVAIQKLLNENFKLRDREAVRTEIRERI